MENPYQLDDLLARQEQMWTEFLRTADLSVGIYQLQVGQDDPQQPHSEDEVYYVLDGHAQIHVAGAEWAIQPGSVIYVPKRAVHYFHHITATLTLLVFFAPAEGSQRELFVEAQRAGYTISTDPQKLQLDVIQRYLTEEAYWYDVISREQVARFVQHSLNFGLYRAETQVGYARVITDYTTYAYIADVFVLADHRGQGLGQWLVQTMLRHPELQGLRSWNLKTQDAHGLYALFGFREIAHPARFMEYRPNEWG